MKSNIVSIGGLKAPGPEGFPECFYQNQWNTCASDIYFLVLNAFRSCRLPDALNKTLITLVPKDSPQSMMQFMPISLCCTLYKVFSKKIVARLRPLLPAGEFCTWSQITF